MRVNGARYTVDNFKMEFRYVIFYLGKDRQILVQLRRERGNVRSNMEASEMSRTAALSTMFLTVNLLMALSLGTHRAQLLQRSGFTWPRFFLFRPPFRLFLVC